MLASLAAETSYSAERTSDRRRGHCSLQRLPRGRHLSLRARPDQLVDGFRLREVQFPFECCRVNSPALPAAPGIEHRGENRPHRRKAAVTGYLENILAREAVRTGDQRQQSVVKRASGSGRESSLASPCGV